MRARPDSPMCLCFASLAAIVLTFAAPQASEPAASSPAEEAVEESDHPDPVLTERIEVTATRLPDEPEDEDRVPAHVTALDQRTIGATIAPTLQDLFALITSAVVYDQVGNDIQKTFDLRGFNRGRGTKVFLDGAPLNDVRSNQVALELVPVGALERVQISRGSDAALGGGGTESGVVRLSTERGSGPLGGAVSLSGGSFGTRRFSGKLHGSEGRFDYSLFGSSFDTEGFRENAGGDMDQLSGTFGLGLADERRIELSVLSSRSDLGSPGALTLDEFEENPNRSFNTADFYDGDLTQAAVNFRGALAGSFTLAANLFYRDGKADSLSTGRSGGEFSLLTESTVLGTTMQITRDHRVASFDNLLSFGLEWLEGSTDANGLYTAGTYVEPSSNTGENTTLGLFVQDTFRLAPRWSLLAGVRLDKQQISYDETLPSTIVDSRSYSETSLRGGVNFNPTGGHGLYASYGEAFLPPTVEQLFAYPAFGSNPDLVPEVSRNLELGYRGRWGDRLQVDAAAFVLDTDDEIVFVPDGSFGGENRNIGQTRRTGLEAAIRSRVGSRLELFVNLTLTDSEFRNGPNEGDEVPLVPRRRLSAGIEAELPVGFAVHADGSFVGDQVLDNDDANEGPLLPDYTVINLRLSWSAAALGGPAPSRGVTLFVEARNVFDLSYATRGIYVFDFAESENLVYVTPAPERRWLGGLEWRF